MESIMKNSVKRVVSFLLSLLLVFQLFPTSLITDVLAAQDYSRVPLSLADGEVKDKAAIKKLVADPSLFENWGKPGSDTSAGGFSGIPENNWQNDTLKEFLKKGITYGVEKGGKYYLPGPNAITGQDALAATLFYYKDTTSDGVVAYSGASGKGFEKRQNSYDNADDYYIRAFRVKGDYQSSIYSIFSTATISRYQAFLMIATALESASGGRNALSNYSSTKVGYLRNNKQKVRNYEGSVARWWKNDASDTSNIESQKGEFIQAVNLMIDICGLQGRGSYPGAPDQRCAGMENCSYVEYYILLHNVEDYSDVEPPKMSEVVAKITARDVTQNVNYKDLENGEEVDVRVRPDTGKSYSNLDATFKYSVEDETGRNSDDDTDTGTNYTAPSSTFTYRNGQELVVGRDKHRYTHEDGLVSWNIDYTASIYIRDEDGETGEDEDTGTITIQLVNERPSANAVVRTPSLPSSYQQWYFYVGKDIDITDKCSDYEGCIDKIEYTIKDGGKIIMHSVDFKTDKVDSNYLESCTATDKDHVLNFKRGGNFTLTVTVTDEMGSSHTFTKVLNVTPVPTAPVAGIKGTTNTYKNFDAKFEDNSTDANDDIVKWVWGDIEYFDAVVDENGDETGEGTWRKAEPGKDYTGFLSNGNRTTAGAKPNVAGTLKFANYGKYRLNITVTDATGLTDSATHIVDVLEDIPIINPTVPKDDDKAVYTVTFINTDGTKTSTTVKAGEKVPAEKVPTIVDKEGLTEHGWTIDGKSLVEPTEVTVNGNITFVVFTTPEDSNKNVCTVTFINTDGSRTEVKVAKGGNVPVSKVPSIVDMPHIAENGWTAGEGIINPTTVKIDRDMVFWVDTTPENDETHNVIFVNTDGSTTTVKVKDGEKVPNASVPKIIDLKEYKENGWTSDGETIVKPSTIPIKSDMVFWVDKDPIDAIKTHVVTFINTDGTRTEVVVQEGKRVPQDSIPVIKDMPGMTENGWVQDNQTKIVDPAKVIVKKDIVFHVDTTPDPEKETFKVTFTNTDGTVKTIEVPKGEKIPADKVPDIIDLPDITENGWTKDGVTIEDPKEVTVDRDLNFWVDYDKTPTGVSHTVTFVNTDGTTSTVLVPHGQTVNVNDVPGIINYPGYIEKGWTTDGQTTQDPTTTPVLKDMVYYVLKTPEASGPDDENAHLDSEGRLVVKQNRKACISLKESLSPPGDPIDWSRTEWEVISVNNYDVNDVKFKGGSASGAEAYFIAKTPGVFKIKMTLHNKYSDQLAGTKPNANKLTARTHTITVLVIEDEAPDATLFVNNANPDFHNYPTSIDVTVASSVTSPDYDNIGKYTWKVVRDTNNNGRFDDEKQSIAEMSGNGLTSVTFPVQFQSGVVGQFLASLFVKEEPGQATLPEYITDADKKDATATTQFEVNWTPCISYDFQLNGNQWAYVDDVIHISAIVKDETTSTCNVQWTLKKKVGDNYIDVATGKNDLCDVWSFNTFGGDVRITDDGFYVMEAVITDDHGYTETFVSNEIRVYDLPVAVITDTEKYRWDNVQWQYKQSRKFMLDGNASTVDDSTGPALHQIVHDKDEWSITPVSGGAAADAVYVLADDGTSRLLSDYDSYFGVGNNAFNEQIAIITPGVYQVSYRVTNSYGKRSPVTTQFITIVKDEEPEISLGDPSNHEYLGSEANDRYITIGLTNIRVVSSDLDIVGNPTNFVAQYRYDSNNDGDYEDEQWVDCTTEIGKNISKSKLKLSMTARVNQVGWYQFRFDVREDFGQETLSTIIPDSCYIRKTFYHEIEVDNTRPQGKFNVMNKVYADIAFAFGEDNSSYQKEVNEIVTMFFGEGGNKFSEATGQTSITLDPGTYTLKAYGAKGGNYYNGTDAPIMNDLGEEEYVTYRGGYGGYSTGELTITEPTTLYITIPGQGYENNVKTVGGFNGGGSIFAASDDYHNGTGGGAAVIATKQGTLDELKASDILLVAGGGGGAGQDEAGENGNDAHGGEFDPENSGKNSTDSYSGAGGAGYVAGLAGSTDVDEEKIFEGYEKEPSCGKEEHTHDSCELTDIPEHKGGIVSLFHKHTDSCYVCGKEAHIHGQNCYKEIYSYKYTYTGHGGKGGSGYASPSLKHASIENNATGYGYSNGYVTISYTATKTVTVKSGEYNSGVIEKTKNFANSFGGIEGADLFQFNVETVETGGFSAQDADPQTIYNYWDQFPNPNNFTLHGNAIVNAVYNWNGYGSTSRPGATSTFNQVFIESGSWAAEDFDISSTYAWHGCGMGSGYIFHWDKEADEAYIVIAKGFTALYKVKNLNSFIGHNYGNSGEMWVEYNTNGNATLLAKSERAYPVSGSGENLSVSMKGNKITISSGSNVIIEYEDKNPIQAGGIGLWAGCTVSYTNVELTYGSKKTLVEALSDTSFDPNHEQFVVWAEDAIPPELDITSETYQQDYAELLSMVMSSNIHLIILGSEKNKTQMENLLKDLNVEGVFINRTTPEKDLAETREFIAKILRKQTSTNTKYVLVNDETVYDKIYQDYNGHPHWFAGGDQTDTIASSRWWYSHEPEYFCNNLGLLSDNELWMANEITMFSQTGRYYVNYKVKDNSVPDAYLSDNSTENPFNEYRYWSNNYGNDEYNNKGEITNKYAEIYVHRRPIADYNFDAKLSPTSELQGITVANAAYDLDHYEPGNPISREDKGLQMYEWTYQLAGNNASKKTALFRNAADGEAWINAELAKIAYNSQTEVLISYRVRDIDGVEHSERAQWKERITGSIYYAPKNSYHHTKTTEDMVIGGVRIPAGTYITTSYEEAISELRAAADAKQKTYEEKVAAYESAQAIANAKDAAATQKEQEALAAEKLRDDKQAEVDAQQNVVNRSQNTLNAAKNTLQQTNDKISDLEAQIAAKQAEYDAASTTLDNAKKAQQNAEKALSDKQASIKSMQSELTTAKAKRDALVAELDALKATDTSGMTEEEKTQHAAKVTAKQTEVTNANKTVSDLETSITTAEGQLSALETSVSDAKSATSAAQSKKDQLAADISNLKSALRNEQAKVAGETSAVNAAQSDYNAQLKKLNQLKSELNTLTNQATAARNAATNARNESNNAANTAAAAKSAMDTAKAAWDAAEAAVAAVKPITNNANVWTENDQTITIPDGVWSLYNTVRVSGSPLAPVAKFKTNKIYYDIKENVNITDMSYSPNGNNIVRWDWEIAGGVAKIDQKISYSTTGAAGTTQVTDVADMEKRITQYVTDLVNRQKLGLTNEENSYKITLNVTDDKSVPMQSERSYSVTITIVPSNNPPTIDPNPDTNKDGSDDTGSFYRKDGVMIYEYDSYDANEVNPFYDYNGTAQKRGTEYLDWTLVIKDPDNEDSYGTANDSPTFTLDYLFERFKTKTIKTVTIDESSTDTKEYGPKTITATDGKDNTKVAPFTTSKDEGLRWGTYRITTTVTDSPNNHSASKSAFITTNPDVIPKHLYVIPRIDVTNNHYEWDGTIDTQEQIPVGDTVTITVDSDEETTGMVIRFPDGIGGEVRRDATLTGTTTNDDGSVTKHWSCDMVIPDTIEEDFLENGKGYTYYCEGWTDYGTDGGYANKTRTKVLPCKMNVLAIKLYDFAITDVADPAVKTTDIHDYVYALAFDELNAPALTKLGYSFYFDLYSMGLKNDNDAIRIRPHFYGYNSVTMRYTDELDVYYKNDAGDYVLATTDPNGTRDAGDTMLITSSNTNGHTLGYINELMLGKADKELQGTSQYWTGRYGLPSSAVFVNKGATLAETSLYKGKVLVMFEFVALKNGVPKYNYVTRGQWAAERQEMIDLGNTTAIDKKNTYSRYESQYGSIIILDGSKSAIDNYDARPVWRSSNH